MLCQHATDWYQSVRHAVLATPFSFQSFSAMALRLRGSGAGASRSRAEAALQAQKARAEIRAHQKSVSERFEKQRQAHQEFLAQDFINMIAMEDRRREDVEKEIVDMEDVERRHIENLRKLQEEQKSAYDSLEQALAAR